MGSNRKSKILVADDNVIMRKLLRETLQKNNYETLEAINGEDVVEKYKEFSPDMILMDVDMPVLNGFEACKIIRLLPGGQFLPIMIITGMNDIESINNAYEAGATDFLSKPINYALICYRIRNLLRTSQNLLELQKSKIKLKNSQNAAHLGIWDWNYATQETTWSDELYNITDIDPNMPIDKQDKLIENIHPDDKQLFINYVQNLFDSNTPYTLEYRIITNNGFIKYLRETTDILYDEFHNRLGIIGSILDITDIKSSELENKALAESFLRFVPNQFLRNIGANAQNIRGGDWVEKIMTILVLDIRDFSLLAEKMEPKALFSLVNVLFKKIGQSVTANYGFIDKYIGDSVMALFDSADNALQAALQTLDSIKKFNADEGNKMFNVSNLKVGIALNTGSLIMGVIGTKTHTECTVISDAVNVAFRLEELNKIFGTELIISDSTANTCHNFHLQPNRMLGRIKVRGKEEVVQIYEVFSKEPDVQVKLETKEDFEKAILFYQEGNFDSAETYLKKVLDRHPTDQTAQFLLNSIMTFKAYGTPKNWFGIIDVGQNLRV